MGSEAYQKVNAAWKQACQVILGAELGELEEYEDWLLQYPGKLRGEKSAVSGKPISSSINEYCSDAKFISFDEVDFNKKSAPLSINEIKDIDSITSALKERFLYAGNVILGNSKFVESSSDIHNSNCLLGSENVVNAKYLAYVKMSKVADHIFGSEAVTESKYALRSLELFRSSRCFEGFSIRNSSDIFYSYNLEQCQDCLFSFNLKARKCHIGNLGLPREKYLQLKGKLLEEIREGLLREKRVPGIIDILNSSRDYRKNMDEFFAQVERNTEYRKEDSDISVMEKAFSDATSVLLGRKLAGLDSYSGWLSRHVGKMDFCNSVVGGRKTALIDYSHFSEFPKRLVVRMEEVPAMAEGLKLEEKEVEKLTLASAPEFIGKIAYSTTDAEEGNGPNLVDCFFIGYSTHCYRVVVSIGTKNSAYSFWPRESTHAFGCNSVHDSSFCIHSYYSSRLSRAFEADLCRDCTDIYFSHNCEAVQDGMFCFNVKNLRRAIGNAEYSPDDYKKVKSSLLEQISSELEAKKTLKWDIYNIGCAKG